MSFKIGFTAETEHDKQRTIENAPMQKTEPIAKKSVVDVYFPTRNLTCSYYNDMFDLKYGDLVYVEGKLEGLRGRVVDVNYCFKIKLSDYKRVIGKADTDVIGEFHLAGSHFITVDGGALNFEQAVTWFKAPNLTRDEYVYSNESKPFNIYNFDGLDIKRDIAERAEDYYFENRIVYIELKAGKGRALVQGSKIYEVEFNYKDEEIWGLVCDCYCAGTCKHEFAAMLQLRRTLEIIKLHYPFIDINDYLAVISKGKFFEFAIDGNEKGTFTMG